MVPESTLHRHEELRTLLLSDDFVTRHELRDLLMEKEVRTMQRVIDRYGTQTCAYYVVDEKFATVDKPAQITTDVLIRHRNAAIAARALICHRDPVNIMMNTFSMDPYLPPLLPSNEYEDYDECKRIMPLGTQQSARKSDCYNEHEHHIVRSWLTPPQMHTTMEMGRPSLIERAGRLSCVYSNYATQFNAYMRQEAVKAYSSRAAAGPVEASDDESDDRDSRLSMPPQVGIYQVTPIFRNAVGFGGCLRGRNARVRPDTKIINVMSVIGVGLDSPAQPDYQYFANAAGVVRDERKAALRQRIRDMLILVVRSAKHKRMRYVYLCEVGCGVFAGKNEALVRDMFYDELKAVLAVEDAHGAANRLAFGMLGVSADRLKSAIGGRRVIRHDSLPVERVFVPDGILSMDREHLKSCLFVNAWDPHSGVGNGNSADDSIDGSFGRCTYLGVLARPEVNYHFLPDKVVPVPRNGQPVTGLVEGYNHVSQDLRVPLASTAWAEQVRRFLNRYATYRPPV